MPLEALLDQAAAALLDGDLIALARLIETSRSPSFSQPADASKHHD